MTVMGIVVLFPASPDTDVADMNYTVVVLLGTLFLSLVWYYFPVYGGVHWFTGPIPTIANDSDSPENDSSSELSGKKGDVGVLQTAVKV